MTKEEFIIEVEKLNIKVTDDQLLKLEKFYNLVLEWNEKINLTRILKPEEFYLKHYYDSLTISKIYDLNQENITLCDVGTGAGFPGIVLKIIYPNLKITLIDSLNKRVKYLEEIIKELDLKDIKAVHTRAEDYLEKFDVVTSRAVANLTKLVNWSEHLISETGVFIAMKANATDEINEYKNKKVIIKEIIELKLPNSNDQRTLILLKRNTK